MNRPTARPFLSLVVVWVLLFPLLVFASEYGFSFQRGGSNTEVGAAEAGVASASLEPTVVRIQRIVVYAACAGFAASALGAILAGFLNDLLLSALVLLAFISAFWSDNPHTTTLNSIYLFLNVALAFYLLKRFSSEELMKLLMLIGAIAAIGSLFVIFFLPQYGLQNRGEYARGAWQGIFGQKNICGSVFTYLLTPAFFVKLPGRYGPLLRLAYIVTLVGIIAMTRSVGAWAVCFATIVVIALIRWLARTRRKDAAVFVLIACAVGAIVGVEVISNLDALLPLVGKNPTLTGRTLIWAHLLAAILKRPLTGYGYMAFWQGLHGESANVAIAMNAPGIAYAENGIVELCLSLGLVGVFLFALLFIRGVRDGIYCFRRNATPEVMWYISIMAFTAFGNIEAGKVLYPSDLVCMLQYLAIIGLKQQKTRLHEQVPLEPIAA